jgi:hypothetical protein
MLVMSSIQDLLLTGANGRYWGCYKGWKYCKGSQDWSIYEDNPNVYIDKKFKGIKDK